MRRLAGAVAAARHVIVAAALAVAVSCSDSDDASSTTVVCDPATAPPIPSGVAVPDVGAIADAVNAVEAAEGGPQDYFEINADANVVNLFVAARDPAGGPTRALRHTFLGGALAPMPTDLGEAQGGTFTASAMRFDPATVLRCARQSLPTANLARFVVTGDATGATQYAIDAVSSRGGSLEVIVDRAGVVVSVGAS